jgi:hypothetical protein
MDAVKTAAGPIEAIGAAYMLHPDTFKRTGENGYPHPFAGYFAGRGGVLGDVDAGVVTSVFAVFEPSIVEMFWDQGRPVHGAAKGAELYQEMTGAWGRDHLSGQPGLERLIELGEKVIDSAPTDGLPLFAGWKAVPRASDPAARAMQVLFVLREMRGAIHFVALKASGLSPVEAHLINKGEQYAQMFGWDAPWPDVTQLKTKRDEVEEITNQREAEVWAAALTPEEAQELAGLVAALKQAVVPG